MKPYEWRFGINDPGLSGWIITLGYFVAFLLCVLASISVTRRTKSEGRIKGHELWFIFAGILLLLGINKQLDLQTLLSLLGRRVSQARGWYEIRGRVQAIFIIILSVVCISFTVIILIRLRGKWHEYSVTPAGILLLILFIIFRAGVMEHFDRVLLHRRVFVPHRIYSVIELVGIVLAGSGAILWIFKTRRMRKSDFKFNRE